jgi:hypothetical protein
VASVKSFGVPVVKLIGTSLRQWESGRKLQVNSNSFMEITRLEFATKCSENALVVTPKEENGIVVADIPNILLQIGQDIVVFSVNVSGDKTEVIDECVISVKKRPKPDDYVYTETETLNYKTLEKRMDDWEKSGGLTDEQVSAAVENYFKENPDAGTAFETDGHTLKLEDGILSVNTAEQVEQDNTLPITSAAVYTTVGNISAILDTI